jgi:ribose transport system ATP-binding protein
METLLQMKNIDKHFPGVHALKSVDFEVAPGEIHALVGENGAGKSTLMKILSGALSQDENGGRILWEGEEVEINSPSKSQALGIAIIYQELTLVPYLDVGQNIYLGREPRGAIPGTVAWSRLYEQAESQLDRLGLELPLRTDVEHLTVAQQQMVEVARALSMDASLIVMDEPTSALTERETELLFERMRSLREQGVSIVFISHRLEEVFAVADRVTVLRDGEVVGTAPAAELDEEQVVQMMVGRELEESEEGREGEAGEVILEVRDLRREPLVLDVNLTLHRGEILGMAGLVGAGRSNVAETLFGITPAQGGEILVEGERVTIDSPQKAIDLGFGFVPEDRKRQGLFLQMAVTPNINMAELDAHASASVVDRGEMREVAQAFVEKLSIRTPNLRQRVRNLSGGNQQKVIIARWLTLEPRILILDEPTRGIDVGAKAEIHGIIRQLADDGVAILVISSELPEVLGVSDRILVMREGEVMGELSREEATEDAVMRLAAGVEENAGDEAEREEAVT